MKKESRIRLSELLLGLGVVFLLWSCAWVTGACVGGIKKDPPRIAPPEVVNISPEPCPFIGVDCQPPDASVCVDVQEGAALVSVPRQPGYPVRIDW